MNRSPLHNNHTQRGARITEFGGWELPLQFSGSRAEHEAVRSAAGVFDISHMANLFIKGAGAEAFLQGLLTNDVARLEAGQGQYTFLLNREGGVIDDLYLFRLATGGFYAVLNAAVFEGAFAWIREHCPVSGVSLRDASAETLGIALQGPQAESVCRAVFPGAKLPKRNRLIEADFGGIMGKVARTGYTGEDGFELFFPATSADELWDALIAAGALPCGLGARDTLRLEAGLPLNGSDLRPDVTPVQAGFSRFVGFEKGVPFTGEDALARELEVGPIRKLVMFRMPDKSPPPRPHYAIYAGDRAVGEVTSGIVSPTLGYGIGFALIDPAGLGPDVALEIEVRQKRFPITLTERPIYRKNRLKS